MHNLLALIVTLLVALLYEANRRDVSFDFVQKLHSDVILADSARILFLTAHPDDECMFFAPTIIDLATRRRDLITAHAEALDSSWNSPELYSLCLSTGDADGLGGVRSIELEKSLDILGIESDKRWLVDHINLKDNITAYWDSHIIAMVLEPYITEHNISTIFTFDDGGVSNHPNHRSLPDGVKHYIETRHNIATPPPRLYTLITEPLMTKYVGVLAPFFARFQLLYENGVSFLSAKLLFHAIIPTAQMDREKTPLFISRIPQYFRALHAMQAHESQLVWFRWLYVIFSRYMWVNEWVEIEINRVEV